MHVGHVAPPIHKPACFPSSHILKVMSPSNSAYVHRRVCTYKREDSEVPVRLSPMLSLAPELLQQIGDEVRNRFPGHPYDSLPSFIHLFECKSLISDPKPLRHSSGVEERSSALHANRSTAPSKHRFSPTSPSIFKEKASLAVPNNLMHCYRSRRAFRSLRARLR